MPPDPPDQSPTPGPPVRRPEPGPPAPPDPPDGAATREPPVRRPEPSRPATPDPPHEPPEPSRPGAPAGTGPPGVAAERTLLAWVRSSLTLVGGVLVLARAQQPAHPLVALLTGTLGSAAAGLLMARAAARYRSGAETRPPLLALTAAASALAVVAVLSVLLG